MNKTLIPLSKYLFCINQRRGRCPQTKGRFVPSTAVNKQHACRHQQPGKKKKTHQHPLSGSGEGKMKSLLGRVLISQDWALRAAFTAFAKGWLDVSPSRQRAQGERGQHVVTIAGAGMWRPAQCWLTAYMWELEDAALRWQDCGGRERAFASRPHLATQILPFTSQTWAAWVTVGALTSVGTSRKRV